MAEGKCGLMPPGLGPVIQALLGLVCVTVLAYKCRVDTSGRGTVRFLFDSSKQFAGAAWMHVANLLVASLLGSGQRGADPCQWYFIEIMIDTTIGVFVEFALVRCIRYWLQHSSRKWLRDLGDDIDAPCIVEKSGVVVPRPGSTSLGQPLVGPEKVTWTKQLGELYGKLNKLNYLKQLAVWLAVVTLMKFFMVLLMLSLASVLEAASGFVLAPLRSPTAKLVVVMIVTPCIMNAVQFWLQDNIFVEIAQSHHAKHQTRSAPVSEAQREECPARPCSVRGQRNETHRLACSADQTSKCVPGQRSETQRFVCSADQTRKRSLAKFIQKRMMCCGRRQSRGHAGQFAQDVENPALLSAAVSR